jgi:serine/threonine-protein kinase RsbW
MGQGAILRIPARRELLVNIRTFVKEQASAANIRPALIADLIQAVDEAASNIIIHGYKDGPGEIEIEVRFEPDKITVNLRDHAPGFDPTQVPSPNIDLPLEKRPIGGLGVHLIRHCVDEFNYCTSPSGGNELVLVKYLK